DDGRIAGRGEVEPVGVTRGHDPDQRLAAEQAVFLDPERVGERWQLAAEVDQVLVAFGPVAEKRELLADRGLRLRGGGFEGEGGVVHGVPVVAKRMRALLPSPQAGKEKRLLPLSPASSARPAACPPARCLRRRAGRGS